MNQLFMIRTFVLIATICVLHAFVGFSCAQAPANEHQRMLPTDTVAVASFQKLAAPNTAKSAARSNWQNSGLSKLCTHPTLNAFFGEVRKAAKANRVAKPFAKVDFSGLWKVIDGRVTFAWLPYNNQLQMIVIADVGRNQASAKQWLRHLETSLGSNYRVEPRTKTGVVSYRIPNANRNNQADTKFAHTLQNGKLFIASTESQLQTTLTRLSNKQRSLVQDPIFNATTSNVQSQQKRDSSIWWFVRPIELGRNVTKNNKPVEGEFGMADFFRLASVEGYDAIKGAGGTGTIGKDGSLNLTAKIHALRPFKNSMRLLNLPNQKMFTLPNWAGANASSASLISLRFKSMLNHFSTLFDQLYGEGETGVFELVLDDIQNDPKGPRVNMQDEVFGKLDDTLSITTLKKSPTKSIRVYAASIKDSPSISQAVDRLYRGDSDATRITNSKIPAWRVKPLKNDPSGRKRAEYVIAVRNNYVLIGPTLEDINECFGAKSEQIDETNLYREFVSFANRELGNDLCLMSYGRFDRWTEKKIAEIEQGNVTGILGFLFDQLGWTAVLPQVKTKLPDFQQLGPYAQGSLGIAATATNEGWDLVLRLKTKKK